MRVYVVVCSDTHSDDEISVYRDGLYAIAKAEEHTKSALERYGSDDVEIGPTESMIRVGWIYYARISEGCCSVRVETKDLR